MYWDITYLKNAFRFYPQYFELSSTIGLILNNVLFNIYFWKVALFICQDTICVLHSLLFSLILKFSLAQSYFQFVIKVFFNFDITVAEKASKECLIYYEEKNSRVMCELAHWFANCLVHIVDPGSNEANSHDRMNMTNIRVRTWPKIVHNDKP